MMLSQALSRGLTLDTQQAEWLMHRRSTRSQQLSQTEQGTVRNTERRASERCTVMKFRFFIARALMPMATSHILFTQFHLLESVQVRCFETWYAAGGLKEVVASAFV